MEVYIKTIRKRYKCTIGALYIDGVFICHTLEDTYRDLPVRCPYTIVGLDCKCPEKIKGHTCIPEGRYRAKFMMSPKFGKRLLRLLDVQHFIGILVHTGNTDNDTDGCILVGDWYPNKPDELKAGSSKPHCDTLNELFALAADHTPVNSVEIYVTVDRDLDTPLPFEGNLDIAANAAEIVQALKNKTYLK